MDEAETRTALTAKGGRRMTIYGLIAIYIVVVGTIVISFCKMAAIADRRIEEQSKSRERL
jgi:hypothetical protein